MGEENIEPHMYEVNVATGPRRNFLRRHMFVIITTVSGLAVLGVVIGVLVVKVAINKPPGDATGNVYITTTDASGGLHTTFVPGAVSLAFFPPLELGP